MTKFRSFFVFILFLLVRNSPFSLYLLLFPKGPLQAALRNIAKLRLPSGQLFFNGDNGNSNL